MINEAVYTLYEGVGNGCHRHRDAAGRQLPMGRCSWPIYRPDTCLSVMQVLAKAWRIPNTALLRCW
jgi:hypothetical protein